MCTKQDKELKDRIKYVLNNEGVKLARIANTEGERTMMSRQINGAETLIPYMTIWKILNAVPHLSADWLVMGEGGMYKSEHVAPHVFTQNNNVHDNRAGGDITVGSGTQVVPSAQKFEELQARVAELEHDKRTLQAVVDAMTSGVRRK